MREYSQRPGYKERKAAYDRARLASAAGDARRAKGRAYVQAHRAQIKARKDAWYQANRERIAELGRQRRDPLASRDRVRRWRLERPTVAAASSAAKHANRKAEGIGVHGRISTADVIALWQREPACVDCGEGRGLDHVVPFVRGGTNTTGNLANRCHGCNSRKGRRLPEEMAA